MGVMMRTIGQFASFFSLEIFVQTFTPLPMPGVVQPPGQWGEKVVHRARISLPVHTPLLLDKG